MLFWPVMRSVSPKRNAQSQGRYIMNWISFIVAILALGLSSLLAYWEYRKYVRPLKIECIEATVAGTYSEENKQRLVVIRVAFINQASVGRTVFNLSMNFSSSAPFTLRQEVETVDWSTNFAHFVLPEDGRERIRMPRSNVFPRPLDIAPHSSVAYDMIYSLYPAPFNIPLEISITAKDVNDKELAKTKFTANFDR